MTAQLLSDAFYLTLKALWTGSPSKPKKRKPRSVALGVEPFSAGRDPVQLFTAVSNVTGNLGWDESLAQAALVADWPRLVGPDTAANTQIEQFESGILTVRCASTAWSTQLTFIASDFLSRLILAHPDAGLTKITFVGPNTPSWKHGPRAIPGRGVRDTYG